MSTDQPQVVIVTPVYEDVEASTKLFAELARETRGRAFVVAVDDGSVRQPLGPGGLESAGLPGVVLKLKRNVGHQRAIAIGLSYVNEQLPYACPTVVMDSDGEDLPSCIPVLLRDLDRCEIDVVVAERKNRVETFRFKVFYVLYKRLFRWMTGRAIGFGNFMALKPAAVDRLAAMQETSIHVAASVLASKLRVAAHSLDRGPRYAGTSKMNFVGLALHGFKALMVFAEDVLVRAGIACALIAGLSVVAAATAVILKVVGFATPGWFSVALGILLLVFLQTGALALMTLMLTGVVRSGTVTTALGYRDFVGEILPSAGAGPQP